MQAAWLTVSSRQSVGEAYVPRFVLDAHCVFAVCTIATGDVVMFSEYSSTNGAWGCRCCASGSATSAHAIWSLYTLPARRRLEEEAAATAPGARKLLFGQQEAERLYHDLVRAVGSGALEDAHGP